jgi:hypothetical protein
MDLALIHNQKNKINMKTTILALLMAFSLGANAHEITNAGCSGGRVKLIGSDFQDGGKTWVKASLSYGTWGNGSADTLIKLDVDYSFCVFVPVGSSAVVVTFKNTNHTGNANGETMTYAVVPCSTLPLKFGKISVVKAGDGTAKVNIPVYDVENVQRIEVRVSVDGKSYVVRGIVFPEQGKEQRNYSITIKL